MSRGQGVYRVSGTGAIWLLENNEWHYVPTERAIFALGYSWADIQVIDLATFCQYPIGQRLTDDGSNFTGDRGYIPSSDRAALDCSKVAPPPEPTPPPEEPPPPPPPTNFIPRILYGASSGYAAKAAAIGINVLLDNGFEVRTWAEREAALAQAAKYGVKIMPWMSGIGSYKDPNVDPGKTFWENWWDGKRELVERYGNDDRIYGWNNVQEPDVSDKDPDPTLEELYNFIRKYDPGGKPCFILWDQWDAHGYRCKTGQFDIWTLDTGYSGGDNIQGFKNTFNHLNGYYHWTDIGKPAIAHFYNYEALEECYRVWQDLVPAGVVGTMYYSGPIVMANTSKGATIRAAIEAFHRSMGWWPPPEEFTTEEVTCSGCGAGLELTISSIAENNISQGCPVCGAPAD